MTHPRAGRHDVTTSHATARVPGRRRRHLVACAATTCCFAAPRGTAAGPVDAWEVALSSRTASWIAGADRSARSQPGSEAAAAIGLCARTLGIPAQRTARWKYTPGQRRLPGHPTTMARWLRLLLALHPGGQDHEGAHVGRAHTERRASCQLIAGNRFGTCTRRMRRSRPSRRRRQRVLASLARLGREERTRQCSSPVPDGHIPLLPSWNSASRSNRFRGLSARGEPSEPTEPVKAAPGG